MTRDEILDGIEQITAALKGPGIPAIERRLMHEERKSLRRELIRMDAVAAGYDLPDRD